jgi:hypothetical protein
MLGARFTLVLTDSGVWARGIQKRTGTEVGHAIDRITLLNPASPRSAPTCGSMRFLCGGGTLPVWYGA